ncbi:MAG: single-stranded-DNA-specific exonuclease RecJ [Clostridia bacterium]|nr:single-stranded-DNA-specific exonuclease RecJ [Clostridia bacterium]
MKILQKQYTQEELNSIKNLSEACNLLNETTAILYSRGYDTLEKVDGFLNAGKHNFFSPFTLSGVKEAVERINQAKEGGETVVIYGDYDADGICATTVLYRTLIEYGVNVYAVVPEREDGYGLSQKTIDDVCENLFPDLLITVDCGISSYNEVEYLKDLGVDVIVTDHHELPSVLPDCTVINCKLKNQDYPFDFLCGAGVAYKLCYALIGEKANKYLDIVSLATVADSMPLISENRDIVSEGIKNIKSGKVCKAIKSLIEISGIKEITASSLAFGVAPRVNAAGRMGDANSALKTFLSDSDVIVKELSMALSNYNIGRQAECENLYAKVKEMLKTKGNYDSVIVLYGKDFINGILGIVSARITEEFNKPTILFSKIDEYLHGSARSIDGINIFEAIGACSKSLIDYGGHAQAAGVTIEEENLERFALELNSYITENYKDKTLEKTIEIDCYVNGRFGERLASEMLLFEPCGQGNKKPVFAVDIDAVNAGPIKEGSKHVSFSTKYNDFMYFNGLNNVEFLKSKEAKTVIFEPNLSNFKGRNYLKGYVKQVVKRDDKEIYVKLEYLKNLFFNLKTSNDVSLVLSEAKANLSEQESLENLSVDRLIFASVYKAIIGKVNEGAKTINDLFLLNVQDLPLIQVVFAVCVFIELGLVKLEDGSILINKSEKSSLENSLIYKNVKSLK